MHIQNMGFDHLGHYMAIVISALQGASGHMIAVNVDFVFSFAINPLLSSKCCCMMTV